MHAPPGGATSISIAGGYEAEPKVEENKKTEEELEEERKKAEAAMAAAAESTTPADSGSSGEAPAQDAHTSVKVHAPPGGASSISFG